MLIGGGKEFISWYEQLHHPKWQMKRLEVMKASGNGGDPRCLSCQATDKMLTVHHVQYKRGKRAWEYENEDLLCLCNDCHEMVENDVLPLLRGLVKCGPAKLVRGLARVLSEAGGEAEKFEVSWTGVDDWLRAAHAAAQRRRKEAEAKGTPVE